MDIDDNNSFNIGSSLKIDHVHLRVSILEKSIKFYQSVLGFEVLERESSTNTTFLASNTTTGNQEKENVFSPLLVLTPVNNNAQNHKTIKKEAGLYHFAILLPERRFLASFLRHIQKNLDSQYYEGMADHGVSESIYIHDPDFNGIEVYRDRLPPEWRWNGDKVHMVTKPLDVKGMLTQNPYEMWKGLPPNTSVGHVHLHVSNLNRSMWFYHDVLGLHHTASYPGAYFFAADHYHHHIAINTWSGPNILPAGNDDVPGLDHYAIVLPSSKYGKCALKNHFTHLGISIDEVILESDKQYPSSLYAYDPDEIKIQFLFV